MAEKSSIILNLGSVPRKSTGGVTGSGMVTYKDWNYQYKPPIAQNTLIRKIKSQFMDSENYGEMAAASLLKGFDKAPENPRVPDVYYVVNKKESHPGIASKYLVGKNVVTLDMYLEPEGDPKKASHTKLNVEQKWPLKKELASAIALSAFVGDHDVHPGNMLVITNEQGKKRIARIDYGHAFNDQRRFPWLGGQEFHKNNIIDFFNRETVDGPNQPRAKLWKNYTGLVPSREMADALKELSSQKDASDKINESIAEQKYELHQMLQEHSHLDANHIISSYQRISEHVSGKPIRTSLSQQEKIDAIFSQLEGYAKKNMQQMSYAAEVMNLQVSIDEAIKNKDDKQLKQLEANYELLVKDEQQLGPFTWFKESAELSPFIGDFKEYVIHHKNELMLNKIVEDFNKYQKSEDPSVAKEANYLLTLINNPRLTVEQKIVKLTDKIQNLEPQMESGTNLFIQFLTWFKSALSLLSSTQKKGAAVSNENKEFIETNLTFFKVDKSLTESVESKEQIYETVSKASLGKPLKG